MRHVVSEVTRGHDTVPVWVSGDAPEDPAHAQDMLNTIASSGIELLVDVRAEAGTGTHFPVADLAKHGLQVLTLGVVDHNDAFRDPELVGAWVNALLQLPRVPTLIHCHMGVNRSASAAVALLHGRGLPAGTATALVLRNRAVAVAPYAPAALEALSGPDAGEQCRRTIAEMRVADRRMLDVEIT